MVPITIQILFCHTYSHSYPTIILPNEQHSCNLPQAMPKLKRIQYLHFLSYIHKCNAGRACCQNWNLSEDAVSNFKLWKRLWISFWKLPFHVWIVFINAIMDHISHNGGRYLYFNDSHSSKQGSYMCFQYYFYKLSVWAVHHHGFIPISLLRGVFSAYVACEPCK
jgi:hypothetical protein